jgi:hypothetical protein
MHDAQHDNNTRHELERMGEHRGLDLRETDSMIHNAHELRNQPQHHEKNHSITRRTTASREEPSVQAAVGLHTARKFNQVALLEAIVIVLSCEEE